MGRRRRLCRLPGALLAALLAVAACGIPLDDTPRPALAAPTTTAPDGAPLAESGGTTAFLFFVADNLLVNLDLEVPSTEPRDVLDALFAGLPTSAFDEAVSQIPPGTRVLGVRRSGQVLTVDLSSDFENLVGAGRQLAAAQIVLTVTELTGVDEVSFSISGKRTQVFSPARGDADRVGACDYVALFPTDDVIADWPLDRKSARHLITRRNMLTAQCQDTGTTR